MQNRDEINDFKYNFPLFFFVYKNQLSESSSFTSTSVTRQLNSLLENGKHWWKMPPKFFFRYLLIVRLEFPKLKDTTMDG